MTIFVVIGLKGDLQALKRNIESVYAGAQHYEISDREWLVADNTTVVDVSNKLGVTGPSSAVATATIFSIGSYYGRAPNDLWEWMKVNMERPPNG